MHAMIDFVKMEGAGNDYVYVDAIRQPLDLSRAPELARQLADRHFGIGGDGLIVLGTSDHADVAMHMWNADGSLSSMCGNGVRCLAKLAYDHGHATGDSLRVATASGVKRVQLLFEAGEVVGGLVEMGEVWVDPEPVAVQVGALSYDYYAANAGNPHAVIFVDEDPTLIDVPAIGQAVQALPAFAEQGVNVEVVQIRQDGSIMQRTFERGSGETLACGSGATAVVGVAIALQRVAGPELIVDLLGGRLCIRKTTDGMSMQGPAREVFRGQIVDPVGARR